MSTTVRPSISLSSCRFCSLVDVSVRCLDPSATSSSVPQILLFILLGCSSLVLRTAQYSAPLSWLRRQHLLPLCASGRLSELQMLVLANTCASEPMELGLDCAEMLLEACPELCALGNLRCG